MLMAAAVLSVLSISSLAHKNLKDMDCSSEPDEGSKCSKRSPRLRFYFDTSLNECLPFLYQGCGGNQNSYPTHSTCYLACSKNLSVADRRSCSGGEKITGLCKSLDACSEGNICVVGDYPTGICCNSTLEEEYRIDKDPQCEGKLLVQIPTMTGWKPLLGRSCSHKFCPKFSECIQGRYLAHCCGRKSKLGKTSA